MVTQRTIKRRIARRQEVEARQVAAKRREVKPETVAQARVWDRKNRRYQIAGLCIGCAAQAAWGHAIGFQKIKDPCTECQPIVNAFDTPGPKGSKWRKCLLRLEYMSDEEVAEVLREVQA